MTASGQPAWAWDVLRCPLSGEALQRQSASTRQWAHPSRGADGFDEGVLVTASGSWAYPVLRGVPCLLGPERLYPGGVGELLAVDAKPYDEAYAEMWPYSQLNAPEAVGSVVDESVAHLARLSSLPTQERDAFPDPWDRWVGNDTESTALEAALRHLVPLAGTRLLQVGGDGLQALTLLAAGAGDAVVVSPVLNELLLCRRVAELAGLGDRLVTVMGIGEELPLAADAVDRAFSPFCVHHMHTDLAFPELNRVLRSGGRFASLDIYDAPLYRLGIRLFGKKEAGVNCRPLDRARLSHAAAFADVRFGWFGTSVRYVTAVLARRQSLPAPERLRSWTLAEDRWAARLPVLRRQASVVAVLATK